MEKQRVTLEEGLLLVRQGMFHRGGKKWKLTLSCLDNKEMANVIKVTYDAYIVLNSIENHANYRNIGWKISQEREWIKKWVM